MKKILTLLLSIITLSITACAVHLTPPSSYQLTTVNQQKIAAKSVPKTLLTSVPLAAAGYQGNNMLYLTQHYALSNFVENMWAAPPAEMLHPLITRSLQNTGYFHAVISAPSSVKADFRLDTTLIKLQQDFTQKPSMLEMVINATLVNEQSFTIIATQRFSIRISTQTDTPYGGVVAANLACEQLLNKIALWTVVNSKKADIL